MNKSFDLYAELDYINDAYGVVDVQAELWCLFEIQRYGTPVSRLIKYNHIDILDAH